MKLSQEQRETLYRLNQLGHFGEVYKDWIRDLILECDQYAEEERRQRELNRNPTIQFGSGT
jgi:hypothetical protein